MRPTEMIDLCRQSAQHGLLYIVVTLPGRPLHRRRRNRRVLPGVMGRVIGSADGRETISIYWPTVARLLLREMDAWESAAVTHAEAGEHELADQAFADFIAIRDSLAQLMQEQGFSSKKRRGEKLPFRRRSA